MSDYQAVVRWTRGDHAFVDRLYSRVHEWTFDGGAVVRASSSPSVVRVPMSDPSAVDPEEAFVASLSSCHMLWFLSLAAQQRFVVDTYNDEAVGDLAQLDDGRSVMARIILRPTTTFVPGRGPTRAELQALHEEAHRQCFLANAVRCEVSIEIVE